MRYPLREITRLSDWADACWSDARWCRAEAEDLLRAAEEADRAGERAQARANELHDATWAALWEKIRGWRYDRRSLDRDRT